MRVDTKAYGPIDVDERQLIEFPYGILGFEKLTSYVLLDAPQQPFYWLQSLDLVEVAFVLINPVIFRPDYSVEVPQEELEEIIRPTGFFRNKAKNIVAASRLLIERHGGAVPASRASRERVAQRHQRSPALRPASAAGLSASYLAARVHAVPAAGGSVSRRLSPQVTRAAAVFSSRRRTRPPGFPLPSIPSG